MRKIYLLTIFVFISCFAFSQANLKYKEGVTPKTPNLMKINNKVKPVKTNRDVIWSEDFEDQDISDWTLYDEDGDGNNWGVFDASQTPGQSICVTSASWSQTALTPENWLVSPAITLPAGATFVEYNARAQDQSWPAEHYKLMISTSDNLVASFTTLLFEETIGTGDNQNTIYLGDYAGQTVYLAWVHCDCTDLFRLNIDDISVYLSTDVDLSIVDILSPTNESSCTLSATEDVTIKIKNVGGVDATGFNVSYTINGGTPVVETYTDNIAFGNSVDYTFATKADLSGLAYYNIEFEVTIADDVNFDDNKKEVEVRNTDATLVVRAHSDDQGHQSWSLINMNNEVVAERVEGYQWNILEETTVCILDDDCYSFNFSGFNATGWMELVYNGNNVAGGEDPGNTVGGVEWFAIGGACAPVDVALTKITTPDFSLPSNVDITGTILNIGADNITSFDVTYSIDGTESAVCSITGVNIASGDTYNFTHDAAYNFDNEGTYAINVTISNVNDNADTNVDNNTLSKDILISSTQVQRVSVLEQFTTENCPNCPPVLSTIEAHLDQNPNFIIMSHHSGYYTDGYTIPESEEHLEFYNASGTYAPAGMVDRHYNGLDNDGMDGPEPGPVFWDGNSNGTSRIDGRTGENTFVTVNIDGVNNSGELTLKVSGDFISEYTHDLGVSLWITEDNIATTSQSGTSGTWMHRYTVRDAISARLGDLIETPTTEGNSYSKDYTFTIDDSWNAEELYLVAMVSNMNANDVNDREIHNAKQIKLSDLTSNISVINSDIKIYPNPTNDVLNIYNAENANIEIFDIVGKLIISKNNINSKESINVSELSEGTYFVKINKNNNTETQKIVITK